MFTESLAYSLLSAFVIGLDLIILAFFIGMAWLVFRTIVRWRE